MVNRKYCANVNCDTEFGILNWRKKCIGCGADFCSKHCRERRSQEFAGGIGEGDGFCRECSPLFTTALRKQAKIETWSANYRGRVPNDDKRKIMKVVSCWNRDLDDCYKELRIAAAYYGFDIVYDVKIAEGSDSEPSHNGKGTHLYTILHASGKAAYRLNPKGTG